MLDNETTLLQVKKYLCASNVHIGCLFQNLEPKKTKIQVIKFLPNLHSFQYICKNKQQLRIQEIDT